MNSDYPVDLVPATPDFVLRIFQGWVRQSKAICCTDFDFEVTFETTIEEFWYQLDLLPWREFAIANNKEFQIEVDLSDWKAILEPQKNRTVGELCVFLARHITEPRIQPLQIAGVTCRAAGVFLSIKSILVADGADRDEIAPSARIAPFLDRHSKLFVGSISHLAPGEMPQIMPNLSGYELLLFAAGVGWLAALFGGKPMLILLCLLKLVAMLFRVVFRDEYAPKFQMRSVNTFRELSLWIAHVHEQRDGAVTASA